ncbi:MAG: 4Fe-4S binding protein [Candidatus Bathyarchaeota archaeon]|nr:4Fe-4S binding protein [Candidatus Bathyarchaeota archaeon]
MKLNQLRHVTQIISFIISNLGFNVVLKTGCVYPFFYCYGCPLAFSACPIGALQHFVILAKLPLFLIGLLGVYGTIFGRTFCGWACPFGAFQDLLAGVRKEKPRLRPFTYSKFVMLILVVVLAWITLDTFFCKFCPAGSLFAAIPAPIFYPSLRLGVFFYIHMATLILTILLVLLFSRFWCRYLCPVAPIGIFNKLSVLTVSIDLKRCKECSRCLDACPMGIDTLSDIGSSSDCILCGKCVEVCGTDALKMSVRK